MQRIGYSAKEHCKTIKLIREKEIYRKKKKKMITIQSITLPYLHFITCGIISEKEGVRVPFPYVLAPSTQFTEY